MSVLISIVSPVYGCTPCLQALCRRVSETFEGSEIDWELVLVDDRGPDDPWPLICELTQLDPRIRGVRLSRNHGQHLAIWAGLAEATGDWVAVIDCDLQDDPKVIPLLYEAACAGRFEAILVNRGSWSDTGFRRAASNIFFRLVNTLAGVKINNIGNFGLYSRRMVDSLLLFSEQEVFLPIMVSLTGLRTGQIEIDRGKRAEGASSYSLSRLIRMAVAIIIRFSDRPLKLSVIVGIAFSGISALVSIIIFMVWLFGVFSVPGWTSTVLSVWFLSGLIMATLGVHGFYLGRIFAEVKRRPRIVVERTTTEQKRKISRISL